MYILHSGTNTNRVGPTVYVFSTEKTWNTRVPEVMMTFHSDFDPELHLLHSLTWDDDNGSQAMN